MPARFLVYEEEKREGANLAFLKPTAFAEMFKSDNLMKLAEIMEKDMVEISEELLGKPIYPHLMRDCAASAMSSDAPEYILAASRILGHSSLNTTLSHYEQSSMLAAGARLVEHMSALQAKLEAEAPEAFFDEVIFDTLEGDWE